jgi:hypothetical protein
MNNQEEEGPTSQIVVGRDALLRVFVFTHDGWEDREIEAELELITMEYDEDDGEWSEGSTTRLQETMEVDSDSSSASLSSTFNFKIDGDEIVERLAYRVSLHEVDGDGPGDRKAPHWPDPDDDAQDLGTRPSGAVRIVIIPLEYRADGSNRMPDVSAGQIDLLRDSIMAQYPALEIDIEVEDAVAWTNPINPDGSGFGRVLDYLYKVREQYSYETYLYATFAPAASYRDFCGGGWCTGGLSSLAQRPGDYWARVSTGLGFSGEGAAGILVHEIGHAHGRGHAPCGTGGAGGYPYADGSIGVWGYDTINDRLKDPSLTADFMSYCDPTWVSDYTFNALFDRVRDVNAAQGMADIQALPTFKTILLTTDGELEWSRDIRLQSLGEGGETMDIELLAADGDVIGSVTGRLNAFGHLPGGFLQFPEFDADVASVRVVDHGTLAVD